MLKAFGGERAVIGTVEENSTVQVAIVGDHSPSSVHVLPKMGESDLIWLVEDAGKGTANLFSGDTAEVNKRMQMDQVFAAALR